MDHLLTCECGRQLTVTRKQAGQELDCQCGRRLTVPTLRGLSQLPVVSQTGPATSGATAEAAHSIWRGWRGPVFAIAVGVFLIAGLTTGYFLVLRASIDTSYTADREISAGNEFFDRYTPVEISLTWNDYQKYSLEQKMRPPFYMMLKKAEQLERWAMISGSLCLLSALLAGGVWISTRRSAALKYGINEPEAATQ